MAERYDITGRLGHGGSGLVYRAYDRQLEREVAIKRLLPPEEAEVKDQSAEVIVREASALSAFQHPNIVTVFDVDSDEDGAYLVMELIHGQTVDEYVSEREMGLEDLLALAEGSLEALVAAAAKGMMHRDIKPSNIMVERLADGNLHTKVLDFGLAKFSARPSLQTLDHSGSILGSIHFLAPEQFERRPLDSRTDLYGLGCVLYYALARCYPFDGETVAAVMTAHLEHRVRWLGELRGDLPEAVVGWLMRLIRREVDERPADAAAALASLRSVRASLAGGTGGGVAAAAGGGSGGGTGVGGRGGAAAAGADGPVAGRRVPKTGVAPGVPPRPATGAIRRGSGPVRAGTGPVARPATGAVKAGAAPAVRGVTGGVKTAPVSAGLTKRERMLWWVGGGSLVLAAILGVFAWWLVGTLSEPGGREEEEEEFDDGWRLEPEPEPEATAAAEPTPLPAQDRVAVWLDAHVTKRGVPGGVVVAGGHPIDTWADVAPGRGLSPALAEEGAGRPKVEWRGADNHQLGTDTIAFEPGDQLAVRDEAVGQTFAGSFVLWATVVPRGQGRILAIEAADGGDVLLVIQRRGGGFEIGAREAGGGLHWVRLVAPDRLCAVGVQVTRGEGRLKVFAKKEWGRTDYPTPVPLDITTEPAGGLVIGGREAVEGEEVPGTGDPVLLEVGFSGGVGEVILVEGTFSQAELDQLADYMKGRYLVP